MTPRSERDSLAVEYAQLLKEMSGISPKLAIYEKIKARAQAVHKRLGQLASNIEVKGKKVRIVKPKNYLQANLPPKPRRQCALPGCKKLGMKHQGKKNSYIPWCREHRTAKRRQVKYVHA